MGIDLSKIYDRKDPDKWSHPDIWDRYAAVEAESSAITSRMFNPDFSMEERKAGVDAFIKAWHLDEDPGIPGNIRVDIPSLDDPEKCNHYATVRRAPGNKKKNPAILWNPAGGFYMVMDLSIDLQWYSDLFGATVVVPHYRTYFDEGGAYPGSVDDLDATYKWMIDNAEEWGIDPERIVIIGYSAGATLSLGLCHRLKSKDYYGHMPRGVVVNAPFPDTRNDLPSGKRKDNLWSAEDVFHTAQAWLGYWNTDPAQVPIDAFANHATAEECVGLPPTFIHQYDNDPGVDPCMAYISKLIQAGVYADIHVWGGGNHAVFGDNQGINSEPNPYSERFLAEYLGQIKDMFTHDLRRPWVKELVED